MADKKDKPQLAQIRLTGNAIKLLPKYTLTPQLPKNDALRQFLKEHAKHDRR